MKAVVACNTASAWLSPRSALMTEMPVIGVVETRCTAAVETTRSSRYRGTRRRCAQARIVSASRTSR